MSSARDARLRAWAREAIQGELEGAAKDGRTAPGRDGDEGWEQLCLGRDVLELLRERDHWKALSHLGVHHADLWSAPGKKPR